MAIILDPKRVADTALRALFILGDICLLGYAFWCYPIWTSCIAIALFISAICIVWYWRWTIWGG